MEQHKPFFILIGLSLSLNFVWRQFRWLLLLGVNFQTGYWYYYITLHHLRHLQTTLLKARNLKKTPIQLHRKSLWKRYISPIFSNKALKFPKCIALWITTYYFPNFFSTLKSRTLNTLAVWSERFAMQAFMTYYRVCN